jgi:hypothetical protein
MDIETVPDPELYSAPAATSGAGDRTGTGSTERAFPPIYAHRPVVIGMLWMDEHYAVQRLGVVGDGRDGEDEHALLDDFNQFMDKHKPQLITFNGRGFDLPVLVMRALRFGVAMRWYYESSDYRYRYNDRGHFDLCDFLSEHGATRSTSLDTCARSIGMPGKVGVDGSQVEALYRDGQLEQLKSYCLSDVAQTAMLFLRIRLLQGRLDGASYRTAAAGLLEALRANPRTAALEEQLQRHRVLLQPAGGSDGSSPFPAGASP